MIELKKIEVLFSFYIWKDLDFVKFVYITCLQSLI